MLQYNNNYRRFRALFGFEIIVLSLLVLPLLAVGLVGAVDGSTMREEATELRIELTVIPPEWRGDTIARSWVNGNTFETLSCFREGASDAFICSYSTPAGGRIWPDGFFPESEGWRYTSWGGGEVKMHFSGFDGLTVPIWLYPVLVGIAVLGTWRTGTTNANTESVRGPSDRFLILLVVSPALLLQASSWALAPWASAAEQNFTVSLLAGMRDSPLQTVAVMVFLPPRWRN